MPGSNDAITTPSRIRTKETFLAKIASGEISAIPAEEKQEVSELPQWVKTALVRRAVEDLSWDEAAKECGRTGATLAKYGRSPAAGKWLDGLADFLSDPTAMAKAILAGSALNITLDRFVLYEKAKALDIGLADKIAKDLQALGGIVVPKNDTGAIVVRVQVAGGSASLDAPVIEAEWEEEKPKRLTEGARE